jgi:glycosyltransferase involved in cell wall biosynthesis
MTAVHLVVPEGIDDPTRPSGGNTYDRRIGSGLASSGWPVQLRPVAGAWPHPDGAALEQLRRVIAEVPDDGVVVVDGLIASAAPAVLVAEAHRLRVIALVHMPFGDERERAVLSSARAIITTSAWTRDWLLTRYALPPERVHVATPGVDVAALALGSDTGGELLCVAAVAPHKGHDDLFAALASLAALPWRCVCVGSLERDPQFVDRLRRQVAADGLADRICFRGSQTGDDLERAYAAADVLVLASHGETYGMVVTEALAHGLPVIATEVGGVPEALGRVDDGRRPGVLVPAGDRDALAQALRDWLSDDELRQDLRAAAEQRRRALSGWSVTTDRITRVLTEVSS